MPRGRHRSPRPADLPTTRDVLQAWADNRIGWWEVMQWTEGGRFAAIAEAAREAGVAWAAPSANGHGASCPDYEDAFVAWADRQTNLLLRHLAGDPHAGRQVDWANLADEIESVPRTLVRDAELHLARALAYVAKIAVQPDHPATRHWHRAARTHFSDAREWLDAPDLRACVKLEAVWSEARRIAMADLGLDGKDPSWPEALACSLDELLAEELDPARLAERLRRVAAGT